MATSNTYVYNVTANDLLTEALGLVGAYAVGETPDNSEMTDALRTLNMMLKAWQPRVGLWLNKEVSLLFQEDYYKYSVGPTGDHCAESVVKTEVATAAASGASSLVIDATTGMGDTFDRDGIYTAATPSGAGSLTLNGALVSAGIATLTSERKILIYSAADCSARTFAVTGLNTLGVAVTENITGPNATTVYSTYKYKTISSITIDAAAAGNIEIGQVGDFVGIELDGNSLQWTNIGSALSTTLTLIDVLTDAVAVDNHVYSYSSKVPRPIEIVEARLVRSDASETPLLIVGGNEYKMLSNKDQEGTPNQIYYDKTLNNGTLYVYPEPEDVKSYIKMTVRFPIQNLDSLTNDFEVGVEWYEAIAWNLALRLFPKYGKPIDPMIKIQAQEFLELAINSDSENTSIKFKMGRV